MEISIYTIYKSSSSHVHLSIFGFFTTCHLFSPLPRVKRKFLELLSEASFFFILNFKFTSSFLHTPASLSHSLATKALFLTSSICHKTPTMKLFFPFSLLLPPPKSIFFFYCLAHHVQITFSSIYKALETFRSISCSLNLIYLTSSIFKFLNGCLTLQFSVSPLLQIYCLL